MISQKISWGFWLWHRMAGERRLFVTFKQLQAKAGINYADETGFTILMDASCRGYEAVVRGLVKEGANVNQTDHTGCTALAYASMGGHLRVYRELIDSGADDKEVDQYGFTRLEGEAEARGKPHALRRARSKRQFGRRVCIGASGEEALLHCEVGCAGVGARVRVPRLVPELACRDVGSRGEVTGELGMIERHQHLLVGVLRRLPVAGQHDVGQ